MQKRGTTRFVERCMKDLEAKAAHKKVSIHRLCKMAGIAPQTYYHWRAGEYSPSLTLWGKLHEAIDGYKP